MSKKTIILALIGLLIFTGVIFSVKKWSQIQEQVPITAPITQGGDNESVKLMTDWNLYKNEKDGFEVKYPGNWEYTLQNEQVCFSEKGKTYIIEGGAVCGVSISFFPKDKPGALSIEELVDQRKKIPGVSTKEVAFGAEKGTLITGYGTETYAIHSQNVWVMSTQLGKDIQGVYFQILQSFKFLK